MQKSFTQLEQYGEMGLDALFNTMRIQDMRSGISHLYKRMNGEGRQDMFGAAAPATERETETPPEEVASELDAPRWSVVSFDAHQAGGLTYRQAAALMAELDANRIQGLCIVTDDAAKRYAG